MLAPKLQALMPDLNERFYVEPFLGGGAVFFSLPAHVQLGATLSDSNVRLIATYCAVRDEPERMIRIARRLFSRHSPVYFEHARKRFNQIPTGNLMCSTREERAELAALFLYLNRGCFNGLYRENAAGDFNVPFADNVMELDAKNLRACSRVLQDACVRFMHCDFEVVLGAHRPYKRFVYFDPPYLTERGFHTYQRGGFGLHEHVRLFHACEALHVQGVPWLMSQAGGRALGDLYRDFAQSRLSARRSVSANGKLRGQVSELVIRNYDGNGELLELQAKAS